jgi:hypothetical protein
MPTRSSPGLKFVDGWATVALTIASLVVVGEDKSDAAGKQRAPSTSKPPLAASIGASAPVSAQAATLVAADERNVTLLLRDPAIVQPTFDLFLSPLSDFFTHSLKMLPRQAPRL